MSPHFRLAWEVLLLLDEHCQDWQPEHIFSCTHYDLSAICKSPVYTKILWWCLLLISRTFKWGWSTLLAEKKAQINLSGKDLSRATIILQMSELSNFHTNKTKLPLANSSRLPESEWAVSFWKAETLLFSLICNFLEEIKEMRKMQSLCPGICRDHGFTFYHQSITEVWQLTTACLVIHTAEAWG